MSDLLNVYLDGTPIGQLEQSRTGAITFTYDPDYRQRHDATPLSLSMPLARSVHKNRPTRAYLQGLLPDSSGRLAELAREYRVNPGNPFALLEHMGKDAAGAVQILPPGDDAGDQAARQGHVEVIDDDTFAAIVADVIANRDTWGRRESANVRWSLPGAQPKVALFRTDDGQWATPLDSTPTTHIIKPAVPPYTDHHINEFMTMAAARHLGLDVAADFAVTTTRGDHAFVSVRYDRQQVNGRWVRLHQEDLCQAMSVPPDQKYQMEGGPSVAQIAALFRRLPEPEDATANSVKLFDALVFNVAALGTDAHAKNYSLLLHGSHARLAPLYDLGSHAPYPTRAGAPMVGAMAIEGEYRLGAIGVNALASTGRRLGLDEGQAHDRAQHIMGSIVDAYQQAAQDARGTFGSEPFIDVLTSSITDYATGRGWYSAPSRA